MDTEASIERYFVNLCKKHGILQYKVSSPTISGFPDRMIIHKGSVYFIELKKLSGRLSLRQIRLHDDFLSAGIKITIIKTKKEVDFLIDKLYKNL